MLKTEGLFFYLMFFSWGKVSAFSLLIILATCRIIYTNEIQQSQQELPLIPGFLISGLLIFSYHVRWSLVQKVGMAIFLPFRISLVCIHLLPQISVGVFINVAHDYVLMIKNRSQVNLARIGISFTWPAFILWKNRAAILSPASSTFSLQKWLEDNVLSLKFMVIFQVMGMFNQLALAVIN